MKISCLKPTELGPDHLRHWQSLQTGVYDSPFFSPEFTFAVLDVRPDVRVAVIENGTAPGFLPFQSGPLRVGYPAGHRLSDFHGPIVSAGSPLDVRAMLRACGLMAWRFDHFVSADDSLAVYRHVVAESPLMDLHGGYAAYCAGREAAGSLLVRQMERKARKFAREVGELRFVWHTTCRDVFEQLLLWKTQQQRRTGTFPTLLLPWTGPLLERIWQTDAPGCAGVCSALYAGSELVAAHLGIRSSTVMHCWFPVYNRQYEKYSVGSILLLRLAEACAERGISRIDLGKGNDGYKHRFMSGASEVAEGALSHHCFYRGWAKARHYCQTVLRASPILPAIKRVQRLARQVRFGPSSRYVANQSDSVRVTTRSPRINRR